MLEKVIEFVNKAFDGKVEHFERTLHWLLELKPDADEAMQIVAYSHDIARAYSGETIESFRDKELNDKSFLKEHQQESARIISEFLGENSYDEKNRVAEMVRYHECGGAPESDVIKDADSVSYFEVNAPKHATLFVKVLGKEKVRRKFDWMYNRITSKKAKEIAEPMYKKALGLLEEN